MKVLKYPVIPFTLFTAAGIYTGFNCLLPLSLLIIITGLAFGFTFFAYLKTSKHLIPKPYFEVSLMAFAFSTGLLAQWISYAPNQQLHYTRNLTGTEAPTFYGSVTERLKPNAFNEKYLFEISSIDKKATTGTLLITLPKDSTETKLHIGDALFIHSDVQEVAPPVNPYQFDYRRYMARQNVYHKIKLKDNYFKAGTESDFNTNIQELRDKLIGSFSIHHYPTEIQHLINALLFGQRQDMEQEITNDYTNAGVVHILAISGLHFTLLFLMLNWLLAPLKRIKHFGILTHLLAILSFMWIFAFITGLSASVVRSVVMFSFLMVGEALNRRVSIYNSLAVSALLLLLAKPGFLFDAGFQLSYMAVLGIVWLQPFYKNKLKSKYRVINMARDLVMVTLTAQIAVLPLSLYYFNQFPLLFLLANIVVIPLSNGVLILGIVTLILNFTLPSVAIYVGKLLEWLIIGMNWYTKWIASFEALTLKNIPFTLLLNITLYTALILGALYLYHKTFKRAAIALIAVFVFQCAYMYTASDALQKENFVVFHNFNHTIIAKKQRNMLTVESNDSTALNNLGVIAFKKGSFNPNTYLYPLKNFSYYKGKKVFIMDSTGVYDSLLKPDVLIVTQSPRVNFDRVLQQLQPKQVIADATNYKTYIARWGKSCHKQRIPFHATAEKGSFIIE
nr:ComEC/Rec2 family competence protein [uncultured Flavobacterium sp.]